MEFLTHLDEIDFLNQQGFPTNPLNKSVKSVEEAWKQMELLGGIKDEILYQIDGVVIKINDNQLVDKLGIVGKTPRGWCALKYPATETTSKLLNVSWQVGRTGKITPIAEIEPIELEGTIVKRATLHNYKQFLEYNLSKNDLLLIRKAGDIIPEVVKVIKI